MQVPLELMIHDVPGTRGLGRTIRRRVVKLDRFQPRLASCRVVVDQPHRRHRTGSTFRVRVDVKVPGRELTVTRRAGDTPLTAVQAAFAAVERQLLDAAARRRTDRKPRARPRRGRVIELYPTAGYGFLEGRDGAALYFDERSVLHDGFGRLGTGSEVRYTEEEGIEGPQASTVAP